MLLKHSCSKGKRKGRAVQPKCSAAAPLGAGPGARQAQQGGRCFEAYKKKCSWLSIPRAWLFSKAVLLRVRQEDQKA